MLRIRRGLLDGGHAELVSHDLRELPRLTAVVAAPAAHAVPYKIPRGTWGGTTYYKDVHAYWSGDAEVRFRQHNRMWYDGTKWVNKQYYLGYYYSGVTRA